MPTWFLHRDFLFLLFKIQKTMIYSLVIMGVLLTVFASRGNCAQANLAWNRNTESDIRGYKIYYGTGSRNYNWVIDVGNVASFTVTNLTDGLTYYFAATAYDTSNLESTYSAEITFNSCTFSISPTSASFGPQGGTGTVQVSTQSGCQWTASSGVTWFTITSGSQGTGNGTVYYSVSSNSSTSVRSVASTIAGRVFTINQTGTTSSSSYTITASAGRGGSISPTGTVSVPSGGNRTFYITPSYGYRVSSVLVDGVSVGPLIAYTFTNVRSNRTISASFVRTTTTRTR